MGVFQKLHYENLFDEEIISIFYENINHNQDIYIFLFVFTRERFPYEILNGNLNKIVLNIIHIRNNLVVVHE